MRKTLNLVLTIYILLPSFLFSQSADIGRNAESYLNARTELGRFSGAVLIAKNDKIILRKGFGFADIERKIPYTPETGHRIASLSKMFTAFAVLRLRDEGKLKLEDPVCRYIENCPAAWRPVRIEHLLRHTSGIPDLGEKLGAEKYRELTRATELPEAIVEKAKEFPPEFPPGEKFSYSNTGYAVLEKTVEKASGKNFAAFIEKEIFKPSGMNETGYFDAAKPPENLAKGYTHGSVGWEKMLAGFSLTEGLLEKVSPTAYTASKGSGGLSGTLDDLFRWSRMMDGRGKLVSPELAAEIFDAKGGAYGYGWHIEDDEFSHTGTLPGYVSYIAKLPKENLTIILFSNLDRVRLSTVTRDLKLIAAGKPFDMPVRGKVVSLNDKQIENLVGAYKTADGRTLTVRKEPEFLIAALEGSFEAGLIPLSPYEFYFPLADGRVIFTSGENGKAAKVNLRYGGRDRIAERAGK
jgi:CubicO group peptidase (beta-lactamase class C family)